MKHVIEFSVDGESLSTNQHELTANQILTLAGLSPTDHYLVEVKGKHKTSYEGKGDVEVRIHKDATFISVFTGPTPVSELPSSGVALFTAQIREFGFKVTEHGDNRVSFPYEVEVGRHEGQSVELGFQVPPDFPLNPPSGPHISRRFHANASGGSHPTGGIHDSPFGLGWEYWSRPFNDWPKTRRNAAEYLTFVRGLWASQ